MCAQGVSQPALEDDDAFCAAINVGTSVEELGVYGGTGERLWVRTGTESLHLWEWERWVGTQRPTSCSPLGIV